MAVHGPIPPIDSQAAEAPTESEESRAAPDHRLGALVRLLAREAARDYYRVARTGDKVASTGDKNDRS
jgi:hypothetical protein